MIQTLLWIGVILLLIIATMEILYPHTINEGFEQLVSVGDSNFWARFVPRRGDVGIEEEGYIRDDRYFHGYTDVQRIGVNHDYCRMVSKVSDPTDMFFACALGGTEGLSSLRFRTPSTRDGGLEVCRDDYMQRLEDGRDAYCRILKIDDGSYETRCNEAMDREFSKKVTIDTNSPPDIQQLLRFYQGSVFWLRFRDDMYDYSKNLKISNAGGLSIEEFPPLPRDVGARALQFNGLDQYLRIGDNKDLEFGNNIQLRYLRAVCFWVYFEEFTNNAHIFDFGNGAGKDNVWCGIVGRGNATASSDPIRQLVCGGQESTVPDAPSGAQPSKVTTPQNLMKTTQANVDEYTCPKPSIYGRIMPETQAHSQPLMSAITADLVYEIWDHRQRKFRIQVKNIIPLRKWVHIAITARNMDSFRPDIDIYSNGELVHTEPEGWLPQENNTTKNYIGKSNWSNATSPYENADDLFKGRLFDFRGYRIQMPAKKIKESYTWGKDLLQIGKRTE
jgi:Concanavalin A-like lectin/glucanases superfamily